MLNAATLKNPRDLAGIAATRFPSRGSSVES
jgi:hypothetical protein